LKREQEKCLKRELIRIQIETELDILRAAPSLETLSQTRYLDFFFRSFLIDFPLARTDDGGLWHNLEKFVSTIKAYHLYSAYEMGEKTEVDKLLSRASRFLILVLNTAIRTRPKIVKSGHRIGFVRLSNEFDRKEIEKALKEIEEKKKKEGDKQTIEAKIVTIRHVGKKEQEQYVIASAFHEKEAVVARTGSQFEKYESEVGRFFLLGLFCFNCVFS